MSALKLGSCNHLSHHVFHLCRVGYVEEVLEVDSRTGIKIGPLGPSLFIPYFAITIDLGSEGLYGLSKFFLVLLEISNSSN